MQGNVEETVQDKFTHIGIVAYEAYCSQIGNQQVLPKWDKLKEISKKAWIEAAKAVAETGTHILPSMDLYK